MTKINYEVIIKDKTYDEIMTLMYNIKELNAGKEIAGFLTGKWENSIMDKDNNIDIKLILDNFIIPKQKASGAEVEISEEGMIDTLKQIGVENGNNIKAHWHIHPFAPGLTSWSSVDDDKVRDFMSMEKGRKIFVFLLSSRSQIKARVIINYIARHPITKMKYIINKDIDNIEVKRENELYNEYKEILKTKIDEKVDKSVHLTCSKKYPYTNPYTNPYNYNRETFTKNYKEPKTNFVTESTIKEQEYDYGNEFEISMNKKSRLLYIDISDEFLEYIEENFKDSNEEMINKANHKATRAGPIRITLSGPTSLKELKLELSELEGKIFIMQDKYFEYYNKTYLNSTDTKEEKGIEKKVEVFDDTSY